MEKMILWAKLNILKKTETRSDRASKLRKFFDMLDMCGIE